ncbi:MAG: class I SAM-dependent methyltransferase [Mucilaginibacter sp.]
MSSDKNHWEHIYKTKQLSEVSWYEPVPETSLKIINSLKLSKAAAIIDVGGGDSLLVDYLVRDGYTNITVLDISRQAINRAKQRLGGNANMVTWVISDILLFDTMQRYEVWHDRAAFHFLTDLADQDKYVNLVYKLTTQNSHLILSTFAINGPEKCSGLEVKQYSEKSLSARFEKYFNKLKCEIKNHVTPMKTFQRFIHCSFQKKFT